MKGWTVLLGFGGEDLWFLWLSLGILEAAIPSQTDREECLATWVERDKKGQTACRMGSLVPVAEFHW